MGKNFNPFYLLREGRLRLHAVRCLFKDKCYFYGDSYYPNEAQKARIRIIFEQLFHALKYGIVDDRYYINGIDRKVSVHKENILSNVEFKRAQSRLNSRHLPQGNYNYLMALRDKFYFNLFLSKLGYPIAALRLLLDGKQFYNLDTKRWMTLEAISDLSIEGCMKDVNGIQGKRVNAFKVFERKIFLGEEEIDFASFRAHCMLGKLLVEDKIIQHPIVNRLNPSSVNSLRVMTVYNKDYVEVFATFLRIGAIGNFTDNIARGGTLVEIDQQSGRLKQYGWVRYPKGQRVMKHPGTEFEYKDFEIPFYKEAVEMAQQLHRFFYHIHSIGWDIAITENGPCFIEGNDNWGLPFQGLTGGLKAEFERLFKGSDLAHR